MKKTFLFLMMTLLLCIGSSAFNDIKAQTTESIVTIDGTIGEHSPITSQYVPLWNNENYTISQIFYTKDEIGKSNGDTITKIAFKVANVDAAAYERDIDIYMVNCGDEYNFGVGGKSTKVIESAAVFSGKFKYETSQKNTWITITLDKPFKYEGDNILICVNDYTNDYVISSDGCAYFDAFECNYELPYGNDTGFAYRALYQGNHKGTKYDPTSGTISDAKQSKPVPFIQFTFKEQQQGPITLIPSPDDNITTCDKVTFKVMQDDGSLTGKNVTTSATIYQVNGTETISVDTTFTSSAAGTYQFYAKNGSVQSDTITIYVKDEYLIEASTTNILANGEDITTFSVTRCDDTIKGFTFYVNNSPIDDSTFATTDLGEYTVYATNTNGDITTDTITIYATEWKVTDWVDCTTLAKIYPDDVNCYYGTGRYANTIEITNNIFTLWIAITDDNNGIILNNNYDFSGEGYYEECVMKEDHRPDTLQPLSIPGTLFIENRKVTITEIEDNVFYNKFDGYNAFGNPLNNNISSLTIPSTITTLGINAFGFDMSDNFVITCNAETPPTIKNEKINDNEEWQTSFGNYSSSNTGNYGGKNNIEDGENVSTYLYVPASSLTAYKEADFWKYFYRLVADPSSMIVYNGDGNWTDTTKWSNNKVPAADEIVIIDGNVEVSTDVTIKDITINKDRSITIVENGIFHINGTVTNNSDKIITIKDGGQLYSTNDVTVTVEKNIIGYGDDDKVKDGWYAISTPVNSGKDGYGYYYENIDKIENLIPSEGEERKYDLYRYYEPGEYDDSDELVSWWENHKKDNFHDPNYDVFSTLSSGRGYLYASSENVTLKFTNSVRNNGISFLCTYTEELSNDNLWGFNLMGNPFTHNITAANMSGVEMADAYYTLSYSGMWASNLFSDEKEIKVGEAFLIKVYEENDLKFTHEKIRSNFFNNGSINIVVSNDRYTDNAIVSFSEGKGLNKFPHLNKEAHEVYVIDNETKYGVATMNDDVTTIPVGFEANTMGEYTIAAEAKDCKFNSMTLTDKMTGVKTNLLTDSYTFMATTNDNPNRFTLTLNADNDTDNDFIYINNNEMIINNIEGDGLVQIYDVMGRSVATYNVNGSANISMETLSNGVYIVRMIDANGVKTQKVVNN